MKDNKLSFSPYSIVSRLDKECLCLWPPMKLLTNNLLNSSKESTVFRAILLNHTHAGPLRVVGKTLHIISSGTPWRWQCDHMGHASHHTNPTQASWTWKTKDNCWWTLWKGNQFDELNHLYDLSLSYFLSSHPWLSSFDPSPFPSVAPYVKQYP